MVYETYSSDYRFVIIVHVYSAYPAVKEAKARIAKGELGTLRRVYVEYSQGWLSQRIELKGGNNAVWRTDPKSSGKSGCVGDIGTHAYYFAYANEKSALAGNMESSENFMTLNGVWKFNWVKNADQRPTDFYAVNFNDKGWDNMFRSWLPVLSV